MCSAAPRGLALQLAPKKALRWSSSSGGRTAVPPAASGGVPGEAADPSAGAAPMMAAGGVTAASVAGVGADPTQPSIPPVAPTAQGAIPPGSWGEEVIDLDADEAEETAATGGRADAPAAVAGLAAEGTPAPESAAAEAMVTEAGTSAPITPAEVAPAAEAEGPAGGTPARTEEPPQVAAAAEAEGPAGIPPAAFAATRVQALQECSWGKSDFLRLERGLWESFNMERERTRDLSLQVTTAQGVIRDLQRREGAALEEARRSEAKLQAVVEKARLDYEEFQAIAERARRDTEELQAAAERKTVERIRRERHKAFQDRDAEKAKKEEAEKVAADLSAETGHLRSQVQGLQSAVSQGADRERDLKAWADGYVADYTEAELDEIDVAVSAPAEALAKLLEDEVLPPADPSSS
ncbi:fibrous sheath CABYR-binding protein-like [Setaria italica]|uniref:fibrous sheath CABYR-binding protein-like n=1 Tax=Setaria italica TaxID=4555 RepID=UPI000350DC2E|nr:fibrous sheath CABYR-binding protein-like [Setaria italica]